MNPFLGNLTGKNGIERAKQRDFIGAGDGAACQSTATDAVECFVENIGDGSTTEQLVHRFPQSLGEAGDGIAEDRAGDLAGAAFRLFFERDLRGKACGHFRGSLVGIELPKIHLDRGGWIELHRCRRGFHE